MTDKVVSLAEAKACLTQSKSPTLARMISQGVDLSREVFIQMAFGSFDNWSYEKEDQLPECFQDEAICREMIADNSHSEDEDQDA